MTSGGSGGFSVRVFLCVRGDALRAGLATLLPASGLTVTGTSGDTHGVLSSGCAANADVVVVDTTMNDLRAESVARWTTCADDADLPSIVLLHGDDHDDVLAAAIRRGARGIVHREGPVDDLVDAIRAVTTGGVHVVAPLLARVFDAMLGPQRTSGRPVALAALSGRERDVMARLANGMSNAEIAKAMTLSVSTIKHHVSGILRKLGLKSRLEAVVLAQGAAIEHH